VEVVVVVVVVIVVVVVVVVGGGGGGGEGGGGGGGGVRRSLNRRAECMELCLCVLYLYLGEQRKNLFVCVQRNIFQHSSIN
jgi:hypothetical protein